MFQVGDMVVYGGHGVCRIVSEEKLSVDRKRMNFFILQPISQSNDRYYVPSENEAVLSKVGLKASRWTSYLSLYA